jgi:hypothetical protein
MIPVVGCSLLYHRMNEVFQKELEAEPVAKKLYTIYKNG